MYNTVVGTLSLIIGMFSLYFSFIGYRASKKASIEAKAAKEETAIVKTLIEKTNYVKETKLNIQEDLIAAWNEEKRIEQARQLLSILKRIQPEFGACIKDELEVKDAIRNLNEAIKCLNNEQSYHVGKNDIAMANADGLIKRYIDQLGKEIVEINEEQQKKTISK